MGFRPAGKGCFELLKNLRAWAKRPFPNPIFVRWPWAGDDPHSLISCNLGGSMIVIGIFRQLQFMRGKVGYSEFKVPTTKSEDSVTLARDEY